MQQVITRVNKILSEDFEIPLVDLKPETHLYDDLELDSLDAVDMIVCLEEEIGTKIEASTFMEVRTIGDIYNIVEKLTKDT